jgi:hypothetical protein
MIMHNWPDAECGVILRNARGIAGSETKLVIVDCVLDRACRTSQLSYDDDSECGTGQFAVRTEAPEPLLSNWGTANGLAYQFDVTVSISSISEVCEDSLLITRDSIQMLVNHNAIERTLPAFDNLLAKNGWRLDAVHSVSGSWLPHVVATPL